MLTAGTSPLYVFPAVFTVQPTQDDVLGSVSLIMWLITLMVLVKYVCIVLFAEDHGEGKHMLPDPSTPLPPSHSLLICLSSSGLSLMQVSLPCTLPSFLSGLKMMKPCFPTALILAHACFRQCLCGGGDSTAVKSSRHSILQYILTLETCAAMCDKTWSCLCPVCQTSLVLKANDCCVQFPPSCMKFSPPMHQAAVDLLLPIRMREQHWDACTTCMVIQQACVAKPLHWHLLCLRGSACNGKALHLCLS